MAEFHASATDLEASLDQGFAELAALRANEARIVFAPELRPNHRIAELLRARMSAVPSLRRVVLVHPSPAVRFLASSLMLLVPEIQFDVVTGERPAAPSSERPVPGQAPSSTIETRLHDPDALATEVSAAFERAAQARATEMLFVLPSDRPLERRVATYLADRMQSMLNLRLLVLVHPTPAVGFLASTLALRCPRVRVVACATEAEASHVLRRRG